MWWKWALAAIPPVACLGLVVLPFVNGPHLWLGLPSLLWWTVGFGVILPTLIMLLFERRRSRSSDSASRDAGGEA